MSDRILRTGARSALLATAAISTAVPLSTTMAQSVSTGADISISADASTNPYLTDLSNDWVASGTIELRPWIRRSDSKDSLTLQGLLRGRAYTSRYDPETAAGVNLGVSSRASARRTYRGSANFLISNRRTPFDVLTPRPAISDPVNIPATEGQVPEPVLIDPNEDLTLLGSTGQVITYGVGAGFTDALSDRSSLSMDIGYRALDSRSNNRNGTVGYQSINGSWSYSRAVTARANAGISGGVSRTRYEGGRPSATTLYVSGTWNQQLSQYWTLSASAGVSATKGEAKGIYPGYSTVAPVGTIDLCNRPPRQSLCIGYARAQQPSSLGDVRTTDSVRASFSQQLSVRDRLDFQGTYSRSKADSGVSTLFKNVENLAVRGTYARTISDRIEGFLTGSVARSYGGYLSREPNYALSAGVRIKVGDRR